MYINILIARIKHLLHNAAATMLVITSAMTAFVPIVSPSVHAQSMINDALNTSESVEETKTLPIAKNREAVRTIRLSVTAYNSEPGQTDATPFNTADGTYVRDGLIAANFLPLGTRVKFPEIYGDKEFIVKDRMNSRYWYKADIWMENHSDAIQFGNKYTTIEIY